jgi:hypothetical protein
MKKKLAFGNYLLLEITFRVFRQCGENVEAKAAVGHTEALPSAIAGRRRC